MFRRRAHFTLPSVQIAELRDLSSPADAARASAEFSAEPGFVHDLLSVRPWLSPNTPRREVLAAILDSEWAGFLALLGERGPWVVAGSVRDLQVLSGLYSKLVWAAWEAGGGGTGPGSLVGRLGKLERGSGMGSGADLETLEAAFWDEARAQAQARHDAWQHRRR